MGQKCNTFEFSHCNKVLRFLEIEKADQSAKIDCNTLKCYKMAKCNKSVTGLRPIKSRAVAICNTCNTFIYTKEGGIYKRGV